VCGAADLKLGLRGLSEKEGRYRALSKRGKEDSNAKERQGQKGGKNKQRAQNKKHLKDREEKCN